MKTVAGILFLMLLLFAVEAVGAVFGHPLPAAIIAMGILAAFFSWHGKVPHFIAQGSEVLVRLLPLLFIPPLVAIFEVRAEIFENPWVLVIAVTVSTLIGLLVTAATYRALCSKTKGA